ncbi:hypothetical protein D1872_276190 [compost metagenome]
MELQLAGQVADQRRYGHTDKQRARYFASHKNQRDEHADNRQQRHRAVQVAKGNYVIGIGNDDTGHF